jgi:hypothetical protein
MFERVAKLVKDRARSWRLDQLARSIFLTDFVSAFFLALPWVPIDWVVGVLEQRDMDPGLSPLLATRNLLEEAVRHGPPGWPVVA